MSNSGHSTRTILVSKKNPDVLMVSVGSDGNMDAGTSQRSSGRSQLRMFSIAKVSRASAAYTSGEMLGWGLRNSVGVTENPVSGGIVSSPGYNFGCVVMSNCVSSGPSRTV
jgi:glucose/arabinose dehydrogenase